MITGLTITGADDKVDPHQLLELSKQYPFVEWGILVSSTKKDSPRYPSSEWIKNLAHKKFEAMRIGSELNMAFHVCGILVDTMLTGVSEEPPGNFLSRIQLNTKKIDQDFQLMAMHVLQRYHNELVFQYTPQNLELVQFLVSKGKRASILYDNSGGRGVLPNEWPITLLDQKYKQGYAGGLSPDNLEEQIAVINSQSSTVPVWIDMESGVRTNNEFDLDKVRRVLQIYDSLVPRRPKEINIDQWSFKI